MAQFTLNRPDGLTYRFVPKPGAGANLGRVDCYMREDRPELTIGWEPGWGWCARDPETGLLAGISADLPPALQGCRPPVGRWLSAKGDRSYVYELRYE